MDKINRLYTLTKRQTQDEASDKVRSQATIYQDTVKYYFAKKAWKRVRPGMELRKESKKPKRSYAKPSTNSVENLLRSQRRTRKNIRGIVFCNSFELYATFTFAKDRQDIKKCKAKMASWCKAQSKLVGSFNRLIVPEFHADGESLHFHALLSGYRGGLKEAVNERTGELVKDEFGNQVYNIPSFKHGFTDVVKIDDKPELLPIIAGYLYKYVTKETRLLPGQHRYWASRDLKRPVVIDNPSLELLGDNPIWEKETEHGLTLIFPIKDGVLPHGKGQDSKD